MDISYETLTIFVFLIPGFISSLLLNTLVVRKEKDIFAKITEALIFSFAIYAIVALFIHESPVLLLMEKVGETTKYSIQYNANVVGWILGLSVLVPFLGGLLVTTDIHMALFRKLRITNKTSRETTWLDVFTEQKRFVIVNLKDGRRVFGWPMYYSNTPEEGVIYLWKPAWIDEELNYVDLDIHGLFLIREEIEYIEFTKATARTHNQERRRVEMPDNQKPSQPITKNGASKGEMEKKSGYNPPPVDDVERPKATPTAPPKKVGK